MLKDATQRRFDMIAAWSVDRLGRSVQHLANLLPDIHAVGCDLYLHKQAIDTTTPTGKAMFQMAGVFAEFERAMIVERVKSGLARARKDGTKSGKAIGRPTVGDDVEDAIRAALAAGKGIRKAVREVGVGVSVVQRLARGSQRVAATGARRVCDAGTPSTLRP